MGRQARILIADDDPGSVQFLEEILRCRGYDGLVGATDSSHVLPLFRRFEPDLLLLDLHMPGSDAFDLLEQLRPHIPRGEVLPVMIITGDVTPQVRHKALVADVDDFMLKPFDPGQVAMRVRALLERRVAYLAGVGESCELPDPGAPSRNPEPHVSCIVDPLAGSEDEPLAGAEPTQGGAGIPAGIAAGIAGLRSVLQTADQFEALGRLVGALQAAGLVPDGNSAAEAASVSDAAAPGEVRLTIVG